MQVPSSFLNPLMSWRVLWVYQLPQSFRAWEWGVICQPCLGLASAQMSLLTTTRRKTLAPTSGVVISKLGASQKAGFPFSIY